MPTDLSSLRALLAKATPGPWKVDRQGDICSGLLPLTRFRTATSVSAAERDANAVLTVAAVNALPDLLGELERLRAECAEVEALERDEPDEPEMTDDEVRAHLTIMGLTKEDLDRGLKRTMALVRVASENARLREVLTLAHSYVQVNGPLTRREMLIRIDAALAPAGREGGR